MSDNQNLQNIINSGGWCEFEFKPNPAISDKNLGRLIYKGSDFLVIQRFNINGEFWDGFFIVLKENHIRIKKAYWVKKYLSIGGNMIEEASIPGELTYQAWIEVIDNLKETKTPIKFQLDMKEGYGIIASLNQTTITIKHIELQILNELTVIQIQSLKYIEVNTKKIKEINKKYQRLLT